MSPRDVRFVRILSASGPDEEHGDGCGCIRLVEVPWCWSHSDVRVYRTAKDEENFYCRTWVRGGPECDISWRWMLERQEGQ